MNKTEIMEVLNDNIFKDINITIGLEESLVFHRILESTKDSYINIFISENSINILKQRAKQDSIVSYNNFMIDDNIGYIASVEKEKQWLYIIDGIKVLTIENCIPLIKKDIFNKQHSENILNKIRMYYIKKLNNDTRILSSTY